jgi:uncharacterized protein
MAQPSDGQGFLPAQVPIDAYGNGGFRFADMSHRGSLLCLPGGMSAWPVTDPAALTPADFASVLAQADRIDVLLVGLGTTILRFDPALRARLREAGIIVEAIATGGAVRTYNVLLAERRNVGAALIAVENARA